MMQLLINVLVDIFTYASTIAFFMAIVSKGVNIIIKAFTRGEMVV